MFYLCSIGSNLDPALHVSQAVAELLARFGRLHLSSVIQTKPVGMHSRHDFLNCLFVVQSDLSPSSSRPSLSRWSWLMAGIAATPCAR